MKSHKHIIGLLFALPYKFATKLNSWYRKYTNSCKNGCENCYNYSCVLKWDEFRK